MPELVAAYVNEIAEGRLPAPDSVESVAYHNWSKAYERNRLANLIVRESAVRVYGSAYYLMGSMV